MKKINGKSLVLLAMVLVILLGAVGGTIAWITTNAGPVKNTFEPGKVTCEVVEPNWALGNTTKSNVTIKNTGNTDAYIRAAIVGNWVKDGKIVAPWTNNVIINNSAWTESNGYYYYTSPVNPGEETGTALFTSYTVGEAPVEGAHLEMTILAQAIQSDGMGASSAVNAWQIASGSTSN